MGIQTNTEKLTALLNKNTKFSDNIIYIEKRARAFILITKSVARSSLIPADIKAGGYKRRKVNEKYNLKLAGSSIYEQKQANDLR